MYKLILLHLKMIVRRGRKKEVVDHWLPIGVLGKTLKVCGKKNGPNATLGGSFYFASSRSVWLLIIGS